MKKNSVRGLYDKKKHVIVLFTSDVMKKSIFKRLVLHAKLCHQICPQDLLVEK